MTSHVKRQLCTTLGFCLLLATMGAGCSAGPEVPADDLRAAFPEQAAWVLEAGGVFEVSEGGFLRRDGDARGLAFTLPRSATDSIRLSMGGRSVQIREVGVQGDAVRAGNAVSYRRAGGTSFWTVTTEGVEEWLHLGAGQSVRDRAAASWIIEGAPLRQNGDAVELLDEQGDAWIQVTAPAAYASGGRPVDARLEARGDTLQLYVDGGGEAVLVDPAWAPGAGLNSLPRYAHTATEIGDGRVLVAGGIQQVKNLNHGFIEETSNRVLFYNPTNNSCSDTSIYDMHSVRSYHTATRLNDGKVLVAGGSMNKACEVFDPFVGSWSVTGDMADVRFHFASALIPSSGKVLVTGGNGTGTSELYGSGTWEAPVAMKKIRSFHTATTLNNERVLVTGGAAGADGNTTEIFSPTANGGAGAWSTGAPMSAPRTDHTATRLSDGTVLVVGGRNDQNVALASAAIYTPDPGGGPGTWADTETMSFARYKHTATCLDVSCATVLVTGGHSTATLRSTEIFDVANHHWTLGPPLLEAREGHTATRLVDGTVFVAGGKHDAKMLKSTERFLPGNNPICVTVYGGALEGAPVTDAMINEGNPNKSYYPMSALRTGTVSEGEGQKQALLRFDLGFIPVNATITSAALRLWWFANDPSHPDVVYNVPGEVRIHKVTGAWDPLTVTWANFGAAFEPNWTLKFNNTPTSRTFDVLAMVGAWVHDPSKNHGLLFEQSTGTTIFKGSVNSAESQRPSLRICYAVSMVEQCLNKPDNAPCSDGMLCTTGDHCSGGACVGDLPPICDDHNPCTKDSCVDGCTHTPIEPGTPCLDGNKCTITASCNGSGSCVVNSTNTCNDNNLCTSDSCNPATGNPVTGCVNQDIAVAPCNNNTCPGETYDVNGSLGADLCEVSDSPIGAHDRWSALFAGNFNNDASSLIFISGSIPSDSRNHLFAGFDPFSGSAPDWYEIMPSGGPQFNDIALTLTVSSASATCYKLQVMADGFFGPWPALECIATQGGSCDIITMGYYYDTGYSIYVAVTKTCSSALRENATYSVTGHL